MSVVVFSDIHGNYNLWNKIKKFYKNNDTLIFLGDACDRGADGIKIMQEMLEDKRVIYLLGNHEEMFLDYIQRGIEESMIISNNIIVANGSLDTLKNYQNLSIEEQSKLIKMLKEKTKKYYIYINNNKQNFFLSHAGMDMCDLNNIEEDKLLWDRSHINNKKPWNNKYKYWYIIHGHTPVQIIKPNKIIPEVVKYYNNHKIDIDMGTPSSKMVAVLDLNSLEIKYFKEEEQK